MKFEYVSFVALVACIVVIGLASADRLPSEVPENQVFTIDTLVDVTGSVSEESDMQWTLDDQYLVSMDAQYIEGDTDLYGITNAELQAMRNDGVEITVINGTLWDWDIISIKVPYNLLEQSVSDYAGRFTYQGLLDNLYEYDYDIEVIEDEGLIHDGKLNPTEEIMILTWTDSLRSNGGKFSLNKNIDFDSMNQGWGLNNLEVEKVLTYASTEGAHLVGTEEWTLDVAGNWQDTVDDVRCVFACTEYDYFPAFCNVVKAKSELVNINSAQISTKGSARGVASSRSKPASLAYQIAVTPDSNSGSGFADGTVKTLFGGSIMEARGKNDVPSATNNWKDSASVTGGIKDFQKNFNYESGLNYY